jgi:saccharopine dehydrogenase-like NADP-dependent oxidoreductase
MAENALELDSLAKQHGVTAVVDCGLAPGVSHMIAARESATMDECSRIEIFVGGLPREPRWPFRYKAPFSPHDVLEEYTRPARSVENGRVVVREALSEPEMIDFPEVGTLEAFNTDGLRSLIITLKVPFMKEKTLRYPGHIELMRVLRAMGLFSHEPIEIAGRRVRPIDVTSKLLFPLWTFAEGEEDVTVMRVIVSGEKSGRKERHIWELLDYYDTNTQTTSMARTTAFACTAVARLIASGKFQRPGVIGPEIIGLDAGIFEHVIREQASRGVDYTRRVETLA